MIGFVIGYVLGGIVGFFTCALCVISKEDKNG